MKREGGMKLWWLKLLPYARPHLGGLVRVALLMGCGVALEALKPWPMKLMIDHVLTGQSPSGIAAWITAMLPGAAGSPTVLLGWCAFGTVLLFIVSRVINTCQDYVQTGVSNGMLYDLGGKLLDHLQRLSLSFHSHRPVGDLIWRVTADSGCVQWLVLSGFFPVLTSLATLVTMFVVMWSLDWVLSLVAILAAPLLGLLIWLLSKPMAKRMHEKQQLEGELVASVEQTLTSLPIIQAFGREAHEDKRFRVHAKRTANAALRANAAQLQLKVGTSTVTALGTAAVMIIGGTHVLQGSLSVGSLLVFLAYLSSLYGPLQVLANVSAGFMAAAAGGKRVLELLETEERVVDMEGARPLPTLRSARSPHGHIRFDHVSFGYTQGRSPVLHSVTLDVPPGQTLALVGPTGAGKSTLVSLIPRFFDPWAGRVLFDHTDVRTLQLDSLRQQVSVVLQEPFLLPLSVADNIAYGRPGASRREVIEAAEAANADDFVRHLPAGYDTVLGERGCTLSGGERQRLSIARALLKDAPVLILDEPTAALDAQTEWLLIEALERLMVGRTTVIIAHRLSTIRRASQIAVLRDGRVAEVGTHTELLARGDVYAHLHAVQFARPELVSSRAASA